MLERQEVRRILLTHLAVKACEVLSDVDEISFNFFIADEKWETNDQKERKLEGQRRRKNVKRV
ncbi:hypothetical protein [uncultured Aliivibrio sp.]|uniref:hypothetical protein n=1 Tax=uncultured Aliivibrio sp. TaxID=873085 RepID=UPI002602CABB|nr:hypothetical protein [uncultured Aliivibrio sp.]